MLTRSPSTADEVLTSRALQAFSGEHSTAMAGYVTMLGSNMILASTEPPPAANA
jgi:hypothetical protein